MIHKVYIFCVTESDNTLLFILEGEENGGNEGEKDDFLDEL